MKTVEHYLSLGLDRQMAEYYATGRRTIISVAPVEDFSLLLVFDNGERRRLDMRADIQPGTVFSFLADPANFQRVYLDEFHCVCWDIDPAVDSREVWSNKVDLCPDSCYVDSLPV